MFDDPKACSTPVLEHTTAVRGILIDGWLEGLRAKLGRKGDIALIFPHGCYQCPDWEFVNSFGGDVEIIIYEIIRLANAVARDNAELELRKRLI
jgi:hypothetical protein